MSGTAPNFVHLHVASGFSMRFGASTPQDLVERAAADGQSALALTDRDGLYGAVRFAMACGRAGIDPILGVDLAVGEEPVPGRRPLPRARNPVRGGAVVDPRLPRVTVLARGRAAGVDRALGWAALCRLVTDTHLRGERGTPVTLPGLIARWCRGRGQDPFLASADVAGRTATSADARGGPSRLRVLLGPDSDVGRALLARRPTEARARLERWRALLPPDALAIEVVGNGGPEGTPGSRVHARHLLGLADEARVPAVLTAAVRHADRDGVRTVDVLDAARRLVVLDSRHLDRVTDAGHLASSEEMWLRALEITGDNARAARLLGTTLALADECVQDARADLGIGAVHLPEPSILGIEAGVDPQQVLVERCRAKVDTRFPALGDAARHTVLSRLEDELRVIADLGYPTYFLTVAEVTDLIKARGVRVAARGSGAGSLVNYLLGISGVDPIRHDLLMERFCSPLRAELPDIDIDVESARRTEIYEAILDRFGGERVTCVSMMDTYKVRHAIRDVGAALGMPPVEVDEIAKAFPHIRARDARSAIADLPELRSRGLDAPRLDTFFELVERLDGLPRHISLHPCGVVLSNAGLLDRTPVEASWLGFPMSHFDKDDVETLGLLKLDVLGIRMQSAMAHAVTEVRRVDGVDVDLDDESQVPLDDEATFRLIRSTHTLGCFQIESPGQRELIGKFGPERFGDLIIDISLFRPGPVKSDMIRPFLESRHGWSKPQLLHPTLVPALAETEGVVVFHEQVLRIVAETTGVTLAQADEVRRTMGSPQGQEEIEQWWRPAARARGYSPEDVDQIWAVLKSFASFGFCKAHAAAFALPTYHSAWLKTHHPAAFLAGVLTHDPGMYPKRLILDDARSLGIAVLGLDVNASGDTYRIERLEAHADGGGHTFTPVHPDLPDASDYGIRLSLTDVKGISDAEVASIVAGQPFSNLADFWSRATVSRPVVERLVLAGAFDSMHGIGVSGSGLGRRGRITRRDLLLHVSELDRWEKATRNERGSRAGHARRSLGGGRHTPPPSLAGDEVRERAAAQSQAARPVVAAADQAVQLTLDLGDRPELTPGTGLPEMTGSERVRAELDVLGLDASAHVVEFYGPMLDALGVVRSRDLLRSRSNSEVWIAGVKVATQTPPIRSGRRVVFLTLDDATGPVDATFFEDVQGPYAATIFHSWLLLVRGVVRRTGPRGISIRATGAWELAGLWEAWRDGGHPAVVRALEDADAEAAARAAAGEREADTGGRRRVLVHASGFRQSPYADIKPAGASPRNGHLVAPLAVPEHGTPSRKLWHSSPGSSGH
jgi:error-prone DNA polymerase